MCITEFQKKYNDAVDKTVQLLKADNTVIGACLYGSANEGNMWIHSDIDMHVIVSDEKIRYQEITLVYDDSIVNIDMFSREEFKSCIENRQGKGFLTASILANSKLLFSKEPIIDEFYDDVKSLGKKEAKVIMFRIAAGCVLPMEKAYKYIYFTKELHRALPYIINIAEGFASLILFSNGIRAKKVNIPNASQYEPDLFKTIYYEITDNGLSEQTLKNAIDYIFDYFRKNQEKYFEPLIEYIKTENRVFSVSEINNYFQYFGIHGTSTICEWLVKENILNRASSPLKITSKSTVSVSEAAYFI
jgi:predicted nucleotidyltransferase